MELPEPNTAKPTERHVVVIPDNDSDWNKKNTRRNPDRAMVYKGQPNYRVLSNIHNICTYPEDQKEAMQNFNGNHWGFDEAYYRPLQLITEWVEMDGLYIVNMTMDGTVNWGGYNGSPVRVYNRLPSEDEVVWMVPRGYWGRPNRDSAWERRISNASTIPDPAVIADLLSFAKARKAELDNEDHQRKVEQHTKDALQRAENLNHGSHLREVALGIGDEALLEHISRTTTTAQHWEYDEGRYDFKTRWEHATDEAKEALSGAIMRSRLAYGMDEEE